MKIHLDMVLKEKKIDKDYRKVIISFIKNALNSHRRGEFYSKFYDKNFKNFVWSIKFEEPDFTKSKDYILLKSPEIRVSISVENLKDAMIFYNAFMGVKDKEKTYKDKVSMVLKRVQFEKEKAITMNTALFKVLSPICIREHCEETNKDSYICSEDESFIEELKNNMMFNYPEKDRKKIEELKIDTSALKKTVTDLFSIKIPVSIGYLVLQGDIDLLNKILKKGLGSRRGAGFGMLELSEEVNLPV